MYGLVAAITISMATGSIIRVRRVRATTLPPVLIDWGSLGDVIDSTGNDDLDEDNEAAASDLTFSGGYLAPPPEESGSASGGCSVEEEIVYDSVTEEQCRAECVQSQPQCDTVQEEVCTNITETENHETCEDTLVNICEDILQNLTRTECSTIMTEKCVAGYQTELKDECSYETVIESVCSTGYSVLYSDQCRVVPQTKCTRGGGCRRVPRKLCVKVPKYPRKECRNIPRVEGRCKKVPVKRPVNTCVPVEREVCEEIPSQEVIRSCVSSTQPECRQTPVSVVRSVCRRTQEWRILCLCPLDLQ